MQLVSKSDRGFRFLLCVIDHFSKYAWVISSKNKKGITAFQKILDKSNCKPNKIWVAKGSKFYNRSMKSWIEKKAIEMYSILYDGKSVVAKRFIGNSKNKMYKYMSFNIENCPY